MSDIEASDLLKKLITDSKTAENEFMESEIFATLQSRRKEIEKKIQDDPSDELKKEVKEIEKTLEKLFDEYLIKILDSITQKQMIDVLNKISPEFIEENHLPIRDEFENIICIFLERINDPDYEIHNALLSNEEFISAIDYSRVCLYSLIERTNDEKQVVQFLFNYSRKFRSVGEEDTFVVTIYRFFHTKG